MPRRPAPDATNARVPRSTGGTRAMTLRVPEELYEWLRMQAFTQRRSMNELAIEALVERRARLPERLEGQAGPAEIVE